MNERRSVFGQPPEKIGEILAPLKETMDGIVSRPEIKGPRREFLYYQLFDALRTGKAIELLLWGHRQSYPVSADSIEVLVRRIVEQAIVASYVAKADDAKDIVDRYLKTTGQEWKRSFGDETEQYRMSGKGLPKYRDMAEEVGGLLLKDFNELSYVAHPRGSIPYRLVERSWPGDPEDFFVLRIGPALDRLGTAVTYLVEAFKESDAADD